MAFIHAEAFGSDGHQLFFVLGRQIWAPIVDSFLARQHLPRANPLLPPYASPALAPPRQLSASGRKDFAAYLAAFPHKAFAVGDSGAYGWRTARHSDDEAESGALGLCGAHASTCHIYAVDGGITRP